MVTKEQIIEAAMFLQRCHNYPHDHAMTNIKWEVQHILDLCGIENEGF